MIRSKPSTPEYRDAWDRVFGGSFAIGSRAIWHAPPGRENCKCDQVGTVTKLRDSYVVGVQLDAGGVIDPSIDPDCLRAVGDECPFGGSPVIPIGASVD